MADTAPHNTLAGTTLCRYMVASLPHNESHPFKTPVEAIALASHASMLSVGFRLVGLGEDHGIDASSDPQSPSSLPTEWNVHPGSYAFRYKHDQSSMEYLLKITKMGNKATIMGMGMGEDKVNSFDVRTEDYVSDANLPLRVDEGDTKEVSERKVQEVFINVGRLSDFGSLMRINLIQKLMPSLQKEGYQETHTESSAGQGRSRQQPPVRDDGRPRHDPLREERDPPTRPFPLHDPLAQPIRPRGNLPESMPGFDDEYDLQRPLRGGVPRPGLGAYGERDLYPQGLGPNDPIRGGVGPGLGGFGGGGMHPTLDDPMFGGQGQEGGRFNPQAPPGARWDPTGPGFGGPRGGGMGGRPPNPFGGFGNDDFI